MVDINTERVLALMDEINMVPRQSHHLEKIHPWLMEWGKSRGFEVQTDKSMNVLYRIPGTPGYENAPTIILQGHMDMVCEKRPDVVHDFQNDPIISWRNGDWLRAKGTSLGADNAVALALFFDLVTDPGAEHPPLEILITSDEETGLVGAQNLQSGFIKGKILLNVDSEDEGVFTIGCAGGMDTNISLPAGREKVPPGYLGFKVSIGGLEGGHSGVEIHLGKANANALLVRLLRELMNGIAEIRVGNLHGGTAHNAIPREASAVVAVPAGRAADLNRLVGIFKTTVTSENAVMEKTLTVKAEETDIPGDGLFGVIEAGRIVDALRLIPHGVKYMSAELKGVVETSMNFAVLRTELSRVKVLTNQRSAVTTRGADFSETMFGLARLCGGTCETGNHYPSWEPKSGSDLLERSKRMWTSLYGTEPAVEVPHAGLECGAIGSCFPGLDMISFGPTIVQPHSPDERMFIPSVGRVRTFFRELLKSYK
jgi:dipeptidase D